MRVDGVAPVSTRSIKPRPTSGSSVARRHDVGHSSKGSATAERLERSPNSTRRSVDVGQAGAERLELGLESASTRITPLVASREADVAPRYKRVSVSADLFGRCRSRETIDAGKTPVDRAPISIRAGDGGQVVRAEVRMCTVHRSPAVSRIDEQSLSGKMTGAGAGLRRREQP
jgi:hypothetical protein